MENSSWNPKLQVSWTVRVYFLRSRSNCSMLLVLASWSTRIGRQQAFYIEWLNTQLCGTTRFPQRGHMYAVFQEASIEIEMVKYWFGSKEWQLCPGFSVAGSDRTYETKRKRRKRCIKHGGKQNNTRAKSSAFHERSMARCYCYRILVHLQDLSTIHCARVMTCRNLTYITGTIAGVMPECCMGNVITHI